MEFLTIPEFKDKTAVITGGAQGIGLATVLGFLKNGAKVIALDKDEEAMAEAVEDFLMDYKSRVEFIKCDLSSPDQTRSSCQQILSKAGKVDYLVNNAGLGSWKGLEEITVNEWDEVINVNLRAAFLMAKYLLPGLTEGSGLVNIASTRALMSEANTEPYSASKGGLLALTHALAISLSARKIRVNVISPGWIEVSAYRKRKERKNPVLREIDHLQHPAGRVGNPRMWPMPCYFCAHRLAVSLPVTNLIVDGGMTVKMIYEE